MNVFLVITWSDNEPPKYDYVEKMEEVQPILAAFTGTDAASYMETASDKANWELHGTRMLFWLDRRSPLHKDNGRIEITRVPFPMTVDVDLCPECDGVAGAHKMDCSHNSGKGVTLTAVGNAPKEKKGGAK